MSRTWHILKREYLENVRTKAFIIGLVLTPVWMGVIFLVPKMMGGKTHEDVVIVDSTGVLAVPIRDRLSESPDPVWTVTIEPVEIRLYRSRKEPADDQ